MLKKKKVKAAWWRLQEYKTNRDENGFKGLKSLRKDVKLKDESKKNNTVKIDSIISDKWVD